MTTQSKPISIQEYVGLGVVSAGALVGASFPLGVYMLLRDASQDVKLVLVGGSVFGLFAILYRLIESRVQISKERSEAYRDAVMIARELYRPIASPEDPIKFVPTANQLEEQLWGKLT
jgi:hypothetical protein